MSSVVSQRVVEGHVRQLLIGFGSDVQRLREDAGVTRAELGRAAVVDPSYIAEIESGTANPSIETCVRLARGLGADLPFRLYPTTGPAIRDHIQAAIAEMMLGRTHARWVRYAEIAVHRPSRGWIDLGFHDPPAATFVATEIQSELRRLEQLVRWAEAKAAALPSWDGWPRLGAEPNVSRLLVVRETRGNRSVAEEHRLLLRASYPADGRDALDSLSGRGPWPGAAILWAARDRQQGGYRLVARP